MSGKVGVGLGLDNNFFHFHRNSWSQIDMLFQRSFLASDEVPVVCLKYFSQLIHAFISSPKQSASSTQIVFIKDDNFDLNSSWSKYQHFHSSWSVNKFFLDVFLYGFVCNVHILKNLLDFRLTLHFHQFYQTWFLYRFIYLYQTEAGKKKFPPRHKTVHNGVVHALCSPHWTKMFVNFLTKFSISRIFISHLKGIILC